MEDVNLPEKYLADQTRDYRLELAEQLIKDLDGEGSVFVYSGFEVQIIKDITKWFPQLEAATYNIISRIVDLEKIIRDMVYHVDFHGSYSIKKVLPALVPELSYEGMDINNGDQAAAAFTWMVLGKYNEGEIEKIRKDLLSYCELDTLAMVRLHGVMYNFYKPEDCLDRS